MYLVMRQDRSASRAYLLWGGYTLLEEAQAALVHVLSLPHTARAVIVVAPEWKEPFPERLRDAPKAEREGIPLPVPTPVGRGSIPVEPARLPSETDAEWTKRKSAQVRTWMD